MPLLSAENRTYVCGGAWANTVYRIIGLGGETPDLLKKPRESAGSSEFQYLGCFADGGARVRSTRESKPLPPFPVKHAAKARLTKYYKQDLPNRFRSVGGLIRSYSVYPPVVTEEPRVLAPPHTFSSRNHPRESVEQHSSTVRARRIRWAREP